MASGALFLVLVFIWLAPAFLVAQYAANRGQSFAIFLLLGLVASWVIALIVTLVIPDTGTAPELSTYDDLAGRLERLADLHDQGVLTDEEFEAQKARLLGE